MVLAAAMLDHSGFAPSRHHQAETDAEVERVPKVSFGNVSGLLQPSEQGWSCPAGGIDARRAAIRQAARQVFRESSAGDVGHAVELASALQQVLHQVGIQGCRRQQIVDERALVVAIQGVRIGVGLLQHLAHQAEAVAVHAAAGHTDHAVARLDALAVNELVFFDDGHTKAGEVVAPLRVKPRHLGRFAAE